MGVFDIQDNLNAPSPTLYDILAKQRGLLEQQRPDVAAQLPALGANTPGQRMFQAEQQQPVQDLASTVQQITAPVAQAVAGPDAKPKDQMASQEGINQILDYLNPLKPQETYGPNIGKSLGMGDNAGGILGLGIQPIDVLAFAIGVGLSRNLPADQANAMAFKIGGLPKAFRDSQEANARKFIDDQINAVNSQLAQGNLVQRQLENAQKLNEANRRNTILGMVSQRLASGQPLSDAERAVFAANAHGVFDPNFIKEFLVAPDLNSQIAIFRKLSTEPGLGPVSATLDAPGGMKITLGQQRG